MENETNKPKRKHVKKVKELDFEPINTTGNPAAVNADGSEQIEKTGAETIDDGANIETTDNFTTVETSKPIPKDLDKSILQKETESNDKGENIANDDKKTISEAVNESGTVAPTAEQPIEEKTKRRRRRKSPDELLKAEPDKEIKGQQVAEVVKAKITINISGFMLLTLCDIVAPPLFLKVADMAGIKPKGITVRDLHLTLEEKKDIDPIAAEVSRMIFENSNPLYAFAIIMMVTYSGKILSYEPRN